MTQTPRPLSLLPAEKLAGIRLIATDVDGTMTRNGKLSADVLAAISRLATAGVEVLPVTGRPAGEALGLARYLPEVREAIAENGAVLVRPDQDVVNLWSKPDRDLLLRVAAEIAGPNDRLVLAEDAFCRVGDVAFLRQGRGDEEIGKMAEAALAHDVFVIWSSVHIHLSLSEPDKGAAVLGVSANLGYSPEQILTIGDAPNDAGLWKAGRFGVTVGTADVHHHLAALRHTPDWVSDNVGADAWLEMAERLMAAIAAAD
ncbi:MAG: HAD family phosphatase [Myxococcales bacterium]|nr:HAD family phosphatase [Myxococcales bacterium]